MWKYATNSSLLPIVETILIMTDVVAIAKYQPTAEEYHIHFFSLCVRVCVCCGICICIFCCEYCVHFCFLISCVVAILRCIFQKKKHCLSASAVPNGFTRHGWLPPRQIHSHITVSSTRERDKRTNICHFISPHA